MTNNKLSALFMTALMVLSVFAGVGTVSAVNADPAPQATDLTVGQDTATHEITYSTTIEADGEETVTVDASAITDDGADVLGVGASFDEDDGNLSVSDKSIDDGTIEVTVENTEDAETTGNVTLTLVHDTSDLGPSDAGTVQFTLDQDDLASTLDVNVDLVPNEVTDGGLAFQGEVIHVPVGDLDTDNLVLRQVEDASEEETSFLSEVDSENGYIEIDTENYEGDLIIMDGTGFDNGTTFEIAVQSLTANWSEDSVTQNDEEDLELESGRSDYIVEVSADSLDADDLEEIFQGADEFIASNEEDDSVYVRGGTDTEITSAFSDSIDSGNYEFDVEVSDTTASDSASIEVGEEDVEITFSQSVYTEEVGDVAEMSIQMEDREEAYVFVGSEDVNYLEVVHLVDDDEDGVVNFTFNTFLAGYGEGPSEDAFEVKGDDELGDDGVSRISNDDIPNELDSRLETGEYELRVATSNVYLDEDDEVEDEQDVATLELSRRVSYGVSIWTATRGKADDFEDVESVVSSINRSDTVAIGDRLVVRVNSSGVGGIIDENDISSLDSNGIEFIIRENNPGPNEDSDRFDLAGSNTAIYKNHSVADNQFFVVVDTRDTDFFEDDERYRAIFKVGDADAEESPIDYIEDGTEERVNTRFTTEDPDVSLNLNQDNVLEVKKSANATVSFDTNLAPGSEVDVRIRSVRSSPSFLLPNTATVRPNGKVITVFDTSELDSGSRFTITIRGAGEELASEDGILVGVSENQTAIEDTPTGTEGETPSTDTEVSPTSEGPTTTEQPVATTESTTQSETDTGAPGLGIVVAITSLLAASLILLRRG
jgi:hypothetical protein